MINKILNYLHKAYSADEVQFRKQVCEYLDPYVIKDSFYTFILFITGIGLYATFYENFSRELLTFSGLIIINSLTPLMVLKIPYILTRDFFYKFSLSCTFLFGAVISGGIYSPLILFIPLLVMNTLPHTLLIRSNLTNYIGISCCGTTVAILLFMEFEKIIPPPTLNFENQPLAIIMLLIIGTIKIGMVDHLAKIPVTKLKHIISLNKKLIEASEAALALNKSKATFMAQMSHELRTPLNAIIGFSEVMNLEMLGNMPDAYKEYCMNIHYSGKHLLSVVNNILDMARLEDGRYTPRIKAFSPYDALMQVFALTKDLAKRKNINFDLDVKIKPEDEYLSDEQAIRQVLINIIGNSIKYCPAGVDIKISLYENDNCLNYEIRDNGKGFAQQVLDNFGMPFNLGDKYLSDNLKSTGLGLSITKALVEALGGTVHAFNAQTGGAVVSISIPSHSIQNNIQIK